MTIRVGLELAAPGSLDDVGGAWVLDLPGCFSSGPDETSALAGVDAALTRYLGLLRSHAIAPPARPTGPLEVLERLQCYWGPATEGRYEVNGLFEADLVGVTPEDTAYALAVLAATRHELLAAAARTGAGKPGDRSADDMLHHVATAEWFYATRLEEDTDSLDRFRRQELRDPRAHLEATREWVRPRIAALPAIGGLERSHRGERWTARKVLRRFIYHEFDHIRELEARARVEVS